MSDIPHSPFPLPLFPSLFIKSLLLFLPAPLLHVSSPLFIPSSFLLIFKYPSHSLPIGTSLSLLTEGHIAFSTENTTPPTPTSSIPNASKLTRERHLWSPTQHHGMCSFVMLSSCLASVCIDPSLLQSLSCLFHLNPFCLFVCLFCMYFFASQIRESACYQL